VAAVQTRVELTALATLLLFGVTQAAPRRIVSLVPATTEILFAIGAGDRVVGVSSYDRYPPEVERLPRVGGLIDPNVERLLALKPDLVVTYATQSDLKRQLDAAGIAIFPYVHRGLPDIMETIRALGARVGLESEARLLAGRMDNELAAIRARVATRPRPTTLLVFGREPGSLRRIDASGGYGFLHDMLESAGGGDVLADIPRQSVQMSAEMVLARAPEAIVELRYGERARAPSLDSVRRAWSALPGVPAVKNGRIYLLVGDEFVVPGPRVVDAVRRIAAVLHPDAFK
jgi:iron complex transport system substrate-binding protein